MNEILYLEPVFQYRIWGGNTLQTWFPKHQIEDKTGECWAISAHPNGMSVIKNTEYAGIALKDLYEKQPELFGHPQEKTFPLLVKILDAASDLSVQVHPDDAYGLRVEGELGKTECWYILDCAPDATIIYGHTAKSKEEFRELVDAGKWNELLVEVPVKKGDFFYVPSGTVHALKTGTLVLEVQQSSDTTYRLYDYDRLDDDGNKRELHIEKSIEVTNYPHVAPEIVQKETKIGTTIDTQLVNSDFFTVNKIDVKKTYTYNRTAPYVLATIIEGTGTVNGVKVEKGTSFIIPNTVASIELIGDLSLIVAHV